MPSSHLFLGLPIALLVLNLELNSGFHSAESEKERKRKKEKRLLSIWKRQEPNQCERKTHSSHVQSPRSKKDPTEKQAMWSIPQGACTGGPFTHVICMCETSGANPGWNGDPQTLRNCRLRREEVYGRRAHETTEAQTAGAEDDHHG